MRRWMTLAATLGLVLIVAAGCSRSRTERPLGTFTPEAATSGGEYEGGSEVTAEEVSPARAAERAIAARTEPRRSAAAPGLTKPDEAGEYKADLKGVGPVDRQRIPVLSGDTKNGESKLVNTILATVNDEIITREDVLGPIRPKLRTWQDQMSPQQFARRCRSVVSDELQKRISTLLVVQEARRRLPEQEKEQIEATLGSILKQMTLEAGSTLLLEEKLEQTGTTVEKELETRREEMLAQRFLASEIAPDIRVTHSELLAYYNRVKAERYVSETKAHLKLIVIKKSEFADADAARGQAETVRDRAAAGEDFGKLASTYSHGVMGEKGGDWGMLGAGAFRVQEINEVLFSLPAGEVGPIVETDDALYIVKCAARQEGRVTPFAEVQTELEREIRDRKYAAKVSEYIRELYQGAYVRLMLDSL